MRNYVLYDENEELREPTRSEKEERFLETLTHYFSSNPFLISDSGAQKIENEMEKLNKNLESSSESSTKLARALNQLTFWGVLIAAVSVFVLALQFLFENKIWPFSQ